MARPKKRAGAGSTSTRHQAAPSHSSRLSSSPCHPSYAVRAASTPADTAKPESNCGSPNLYERPVNFALSGSADSDDRGLATSVHGWEAFGGKNRLTGPRQIRPQPTSTSNSIPDVTSTHEGSFRMNGSSEEKFDMGSNTMDQRHDQKLVSRDESPTGIRAEVSGSTDGVRGSPASESSPLFFSDAVGETSKIAITQQEIAVPTPSPSPSLSSSVEEVIFVGRCNMSKVIVESPPSDPWLRPSEHVEESSQGFTQNGPMQEADLDPVPIAATRCATAPGIHSPRQPLSSHEPYSSLRDMNIMARKMTSSTIAGQPTTATAVDSFEEHGKDWIHRSKPGVGWSKPRGVKRKSRRRAGFLTQEEMNAAVEDYMENLAKYGDGEAVTTLHMTHRELALSDGETDRRELGAGHCPTLSTPLVNRARSPPLFRNQLRDLTTEPSSNGDDAVDAVENLQLLDGAMDEYGGLMEVDLVSSGDSAAELVERSAKLGAHEPANAAAPPRNRSLLTASALADFVERDQYNGFDIMDFDRPSLRKRGKGKVPDFGLSDENVEATLRSTWQLDRERKKKRKEEREEARAALGPSGNRRRKKSHKDKILDGMSMFDIREELQMFLSSTDDTYPLPPMDKFRRKMVHTIAGKFGLKTVSKGKGLSRYITLTKTNRTLAFDDDAFGEISKTVNWGCLPRGRTRQEPSMRSDKLDARKAASFSNTQRSRTTGNAGIRYRDGEVVGSAAPEIGMENRGWGLLEKMGWTAGTALGAGDNKGILEPINHVVKNSRAGLG